VASLPAYRFAEFVVSRRRRQLLRHGEALPLIPKYFDLLVLLIERRPDVVTRRDIFDAVWRDVIVSDGALTQAVRTLRRVLGDDSREPTYIRTVSRHGYSFVFAEVEESDSDNGSPPAHERQRIGSAAAAEPSVEARIASLAARLRQVDDCVETIEERRDLAQQLHALGTNEAVRALVGSPGHAAALALLRDTRWEVAGAGPVPLLGQPEGAAALWWLTRWRARDALRITARRWAQAAGGAAATGVLAGLLGGALLVSAPAAAAPVTAIPVLMALGGLAGFVGAAGVAAGMAAAEAVSRSRRTLAIVAGGVAGGALIGLLADVMATWTLATLFGLPVLISGAVQGAVLGGTVAVGYAVTTARHGGGIVAPTGAARWRAAVTAAALTGLAGAVLSRMGFPLVGGIIHHVAAASRGSQMILTPLGAWLGEPAFGPLTQALVGAAEGAFFGFGLTWGLTRRLPRS
jgi:DNA-binding winged helix-turn-helix (wHTH) protein